MALRGMPARASRAFSTCCGCSSPAGAGLSASILSAPAQGSGAASLRLCVRLALLPFAACAAQFAFRLDCYGDWLPNSAYAKVAFTRERLRAGLEYLGVGLLWLAALALPALASVVAAWR